MKGPKEDPEAKAIRLQERASATAEQDRSTQSLAAGMTSDFRSMYGNPFNLFNIMRRR